MFKLIKNVEVYSPTYLGKKDILICHDKIVKIDDAIDFPDATVYNKEGLIVIPGIIDQHIHVTGGGGEGGYHTRTPEVKLSDLIIGGVTTVIGVLGTDSYTRNVESLVAKTKALKNEGVSAYCLTGAYRYPSPTITSSVGKDITFIEEIIGVKIALSDHRESFITRDELKRLVSEVRIASLISQKCGMVTIHMGDDPKGLKLLYEISDETSIPLFHLRPTHVNRNDELFHDALLFLEKGGYIDLTVGPDFEKTKASVETIKEKHLNCNLVTFSSDGNGSFSSYDNNGQLIKIGVASCDGILQTMRYLIRNGYAIEECIQYGCTNVARAIYLHHNKGFIHVGYDADLLILDKDYELDTVITLGKVMMENKEILMKGTFE